MNGGLYQMITLVSAVHGSIAGNRYTTKTLVTQTFLRNCNLTFLNPARKDSQESHDLEQWLLSAVGRGVIGAWLIYGSTAELIAPDHQSVAFVGGGGTWKIVLAFSDRSEVWVSHWQFKKPGLFINRSGRWNVTYQCVTKYDMALEPPNIDLHQTANQLSDVLARIRDFATKHRYLAWADCFDRGYKTLQAHDNVLGSEIGALVYHDCCSESAKRILLAASRAWVFGGMGSWNDIVVEPAQEHEEYERLSSELYETIMKAIQQACSSFSNSNRV